MKVLTPMQMQAAENLAFLSDEKRPEKYMDEVGKKIASKIAKFCHKTFDSNKDHMMIYLLCGKGNNAGDAYTVGSQLLKKGFRVLAHQIKSPSYSPLLDKKLEAFKKKGGIIQVFTASELNLFEEPGVIIDGLCGLGFKGTLQNHYSKLVEIANNSRLKIFSIDIPSGINGLCGFESHELSNSAIKAYKTYTLEFPKLGLFLNDAWNHSRSLEVIEFGLPEQIKFNSEAEAIILSNADLRSLLPKILKSRHKYSTGVVSAWAGSKGMEGASVLATRSALRAGCGLVKLLIEENNYLGFSRIDPEIVKILFQHREPIEDLVYKMISLFNNSSAFFIGPGLSTEAEVSKLFAKIIPELKVPGVLDADALNLVAQLNCQLPNNVVLTPHLGELQRLLNQPEKILTCDIELFEKCKKFVETKQTTLVLKGSPSFIFHPGEIPVIMHRGDPGMATAGSGDVLTGLIASFLAQGRSPFESAILGTYMHALAGEKAAGQLSSYSLTASDIISNIPKVFISIMKTSVE